MSSLWIFPQLPLLSAVSFDRNDKRVTFLNVFDVFYLRECLKILVLFSEFDKLRAFCDHVPYVPTYLTCICALRIYVPTCLLPLNCYVPTCLRVLNYYVLICLCVYVPIYIFRAYVPFCLKILSAYNYSGPQNLHISS